ncbi:MAG: hypothetical protein HY794_01285 [Desulfarculus sp.]|nr:hypothetical protein [Desulfarculus sp.]
MRGFLASRYLVWLLGALLGGYSQVAWLLAHGGRQEAIARLSLGPLAGAVLLWLVAEALARAGRYFGWRPWEPLQRLGLWVAATAWSLSGLANRGGRRAWLIALALALVLSSLPAYHLLLRPLQGAGLVRQYFLEHLEPSGPAGLRCLLLEGLDQAGPVNDLGVLQTWDFASLEQVPGGRQRFFALRGLGVIEVPKSGVYGFGGQADDGLLLLIDGRVVVDNRMEGPARPMWGKVYLTAGLHALDLRYLQYAGGASLRLQWQPPGQDRQPLGQANLRPLAAGTPLAPITRLRLAHGLEPRPFSTYDPWESGRFWGLSW